MLNNKILKNIGSKFIQPLTFLDILLWKKNLIYIHKNAILGKTKQLQFVDPCFVIKNK